MIGMLKRTKGNSLPFLSFIFPLNNYEGVTTNLRKGIIAEIFRTLLVKHHNESVPNL